MSRSARGEGLPDYGWVVVAAAFAQNFVTTAILFSFGTYFESLSREFGADRGTVSLVFALTNLLFFSLGAATGFLADRFGARLLSLGAALAYLIGLALASRAGALWQIYLTYSFFVAIGVGSTIVPAVATVQRWFTRRRTMATGLAVSGSGAGTLIGPAASTWLIQTSDWRTAYLATGLAAAAITAIAGCFLIRPPQATVRSSTVQATAGGAGRPVPAAADLTAGQAVRTREFLWLYVAQAFIVLPMYIALAHVVPYARGEGLDAGSAALALSAIGIGNAISRITLGPLADRAGRRRAFAATMAVMACLMAIWPVLPVRLVWPLLIFSFLVGAAYGQFVALCPTLLADYFGTGHIGSLVGVYYTGAGLGSLAGPWLAGAVFDRTGTYVPAIAVGAITAAAGAILVLRLADPPAFRARFDTRGRRPNTDPEPT